MQLSTVKISNLLSFPYIENLTEIEGVKFHNSEEGIINIIIGPNGSGKSNLLDIIHAMRKYGITINYEMTQKIRENNNTEHHLSKHRATEDKPSHIYFSLLLSQHDMDNLFFLNKYGHILNTIISEYSDLKFRFTNVTDEDLNNQQKIPLYCTIDNNNNTIKLRRHNIDPVMTFIYDYLQHFELIQHCMIIYNTDIRQTNERERYPLRNTFAIISPHDRTGMNRGNENTLPHCQINRPLRLFLKKYHNLTHIDTQSENFLLGKDFIDTINTTMKKYVNLTIKLGVSDEGDLSSPLRSPQHDVNNKRFVIAKDKTTHNQIIFTDDEGYSLSYDELSSGEQSFVSIILLIYSHDLHNGLLIIDEPEIHLHPQSQELFIELLEEMKTRQSIQCIIATHSPSMINEHNINHVFRCRKEHNSTIITSPQNHIGEDDATLLQMLKFDTIAKIFFVDKIILVEGETDMYFINHYINYLKEQPSRSQNITNFEIVTIGGKGGFKRRKRFLTKFTIRAHYIGDWDNIIEYGIVNHIDHSKKLRSIQSRGSHYEGIVAAMKLHNPAQHQLIIEGIRKLYNDNVYLLSEGDLESYLGLPAKGLDDTVYFCQHNFVNWMNNPHYDDKRRELDHIIEMIFG